LPLLGRIVTGPPLIVDPLGSVEAAVPKGQSESTGSPVDGTNPASRSEAVAAAIDAQWTPGIDRWSPTAILSSLGVLNCYLGLPSM